METYEFVELPGYGEMVFTRHADGSVTTDSAWPEYLLVSREFLGMMRHARWEDPVLTFWSGERYEVCEPFVGPGDVGFRRAA
jgi:hypothetical protein